MWTVTFVFSGYRRGTLPAAKLGEEARVLFLALHGRRTVMRQIPDGTMDAGLDVSFLPRAHQLTARVTHLDPDGLVRRFLGVEVDESAPGRFLATKVLCPKLAPRRHDRHRAAGRMSNR